MIPFNKPYTTGSEVKYIKDVISSEKLSGNGLFTKKCQVFLQDKYGFKKVLLTTSCTDALEMAAILLNIQPGDEIIAPSYTFVSTVNAFVSKGAKVLFADSRSDHPGIDENKVEKLITKRTKAIIPVHYAGVSCDMDKIMDIANRHNLYVVEDAAQAVESYYTCENGIKTPLGSIGHLGAFSFHETKNISSGEGGMVVINDERFINRAEIIWEKGTNRAAFLRGEVDKYEWIDIGSSFLPSEIIAAFLFAQLESLEIIQKKRKRIWNNYYMNLSTLSEKGFLKLPFLPDYASNNAQMFYIVCNNLEERTKLVEHLKKSDIMAVFHYQSLHKSPYFIKKNIIPFLPQSDRYSDCLLRLPFYFELSKKEIDFICDTIKSFYQQQKQSKQNHLNSLSGTNI